MIDRKTADQLLALDEKNFLDRIAWREREDAVRDAHPEGWYKAWSEFLKNDPEPPYFAVSLIAIEVRTERTDHDDGSTSVTYHYEWDHDMIKMVPDTVQWAKDNGVVIPEDGNGPNS